MGEHVDPNAVRSTIDLSALPAAELKLPAGDAGPAAPPVILDLVEYYPNTRGDDIKHKHQAEYLGVVERASDGFCVMRMKGSSATRAHQIEVGEVYAITLRGQRTILQTPRERWKIRAQEIKRLVEGEIEEWARPYFDPGSDKWFKRAADYRDETDEDGERKYRRLILGEQPARRGGSSPSPTPAPAGCAVFLVAGFGLLTGGLVLLSQLL